jgi:ribose transport system permease protein
MKRLLAEYGMIFVLILLVVLFSLLTLNRESAVDGAAADRLWRENAEKIVEAGDLFIIGAVNKKSAEFAELFAARAKDRLATVHLAIGNPVQVRETWDRKSQEFQGVPVVAVSGDVENWLLLDALKKEMPTLELVAPSEKMQSDFLKPANLLAIVDRIVVIAVIAIGMTLVILTGGIDLSVGSLIAFAAVVATLVMKLLGGLAAPWWVVWAGFLTAILSCGLIGSVGGFLVAQFKVASFITTLAIMMMARGFAFLMTGGFSIYQVPETLPWLGRGTTMGIPNTVILLVLLYVGAHLFMSHTRYGRYIYAVGGNEEAARLSGVPVKGILIFVYLVAGLCAGFGGCIQASQIGSGAPNLGKMFELYVIAAVVVGGTSLSGGSGKILGTLIGAFIISVIQNGMNLLGFESYVQDVVLGGVILAAVLIDKARSSGNWRWEKAGA